ncbi:WD40-repeat-containing domain protein [Xylaria sp. FL1042]|nr:WD40-repeat-containing domain protein [Xylaria sp. FL1042]
MFKFEKLALKRDSTLFSTLSTRYSESVSQLLSDSFANNEVPKEELARFRKQHLQFSFRCRFAPCTRASLGLASETPRASHEQLHIKRLFCDKPNCSRGRLGFRHQKDLDTHKRTYHEEGSILVPPTVRKTFDTRTVVSPIRSTSVEGGLFLRQDDVKFATLLPFDTDRLDKAVKEWKDSQWQKTCFAHMKNEKLKSTLDVNLLHTFDYNDNSRRPCIDISPDDQLLATGQDKQVLVFDVRSGERIYTFTIDNNANDKYSVSVVRFAGDGRYLVAGWLGGRLTIWELQGSGSLFKVFQEAATTLYDLDVAPDGYTIVTALEYATSPRHHIVAWDLRDESGSKPRAIGILPLGVHTVAISPDSQLVATSCFDYTIYLMHIQTGDVLSKFEDKTYSAQFSPDSQTLISACLDGSVITWQINLADPRKSSCSPQPLQQLRLHRGAVLCGAMTQCGRWILSGSADSSIIFWDTETGEPHLSLIGHTFSVTELAVGHSSRIFASASRDRKVRVWSYSA